MKPFNLEAAMRGDPLVTRTGKPARFIAHVPDAKENSVVVIFSGDAPRTYNINGQFWGEGSPQDTDIFMATKKRIVWVNFYAETKGGYYYDTEVEANDASALNFKRLGGKAYPVKIEE